MSIQLDMFTTVEPEQPLVGLRVKMDRPVDRDRPCCRNICSLAPDKGPHAVERVCIDCGQHRGWLSQSTAHWIGHAISRFGAPTTPIAVRKAHTFQEEAPAQKNGSR